MRKEAVAAAGALVAMCGAVFAGTNYVNNSMSTYAGQEEVVPAAALSPLHADTYQFIVSGYPAANESYAAASSGTALATATRSGGSAASPIEARYRTWDESDGIALRSDKYRATIIIIR